MEKCFKILTESVTDYAKKYNLRNPVRTDNTNKIQQKKKY